MTRQNPAADAAAGAEQAVIYTRVSTEEQGSNYSLPSQAAACRAFAEQEGYAVVGEYQDTTSGLELDRPQLEALFARVADGGVQVVIVYDVDRLSRGGPAHHGILQFRLEKYGARFEYVRGGYNSDSHEATLSRLIRQTVAWYENQQRLERVLRGRTGLARAGRVIAGSRAPYGYTYCDGNLAIVEELAVVVRCIFAWRLEGLSVAAIARRLSDERVPTAADLNPTIPKLRAPGMWQAASVHKILCNRTYTGVWNYGKNQRTTVDGEKRLLPRSEAQWIPVVVPPLIDPETFEKAQAVADRLRKERKHEYTYEFLLRGRVFCTCGYACRARHAPGQVSCYHCSGDGGTYKLKRCERRFRAQAPLLDDLVWAAVTEMLLDERNLQEAVRVQREKAQAEHQPLTEHLEATGNGIAAVEREMAQMVDLFLAGEYTREILAEQKALLVHKHQRLKAEKERLERRLAKVMISPVAEGALQEMAQRIRAGAATLPAAARRQVIELLDVRVQALSRSQVLLSCLLPLTASQEEAGGADAGAGEDAEKFAMSCTLQLKGKSKKQPQPPCVRSEAESGAAPAA